MPKAHTPMTELAREALDVPFGAARRRTDAAQARDAAFESVFHRHWPQVFGVAYRLTGDPAAAEDLALEAFWRLWERPPGRGDNLAGWLHRVAVRLGYNALRASRRRAGHEARAGAPSGADPRMADPHVAAEIAETRTRVRKTLARLDAREAQLLILRQAGLSYREIAAALGVAPASVGTLIARAERAFAQHHGPAESGQPGTQP